MVQKVGAAARVDQPLGSGITRGFFAVALVASCVFGLVSCQAANDEGTPQQAEILTMKLPSDVSAKGVLLAAVLLSTSDIEAALAEGLVTPAEVDLAQAAIDDGLLDQWRQRAEQDLDAQ